MRRYYVTLAKKRSPNRIVIFRKSDNLDLLEMSTKMARQVLDWAGKDLGFEEGINDLTEMRKHL